MFTFGKTVTSVTLTPAIQNIGIIGCGWLGIDLALHLIELGYEIKGTTRSKSKLHTLKLNNIDAYPIQLNETEICGPIDDFLKSVETLVVNIPPGLRKNPKKNHVSEVQQLICKVERSDVKNVLYISSTSVFEDNKQFPVITHQTKPNGTSNVAKQLMTIENLLKTNSNFKTTILRFAGLIGDHRHPGKILSGRTKLNNHNAPINLIHKKDCIGIISSIIKLNAWNMSFNAAYPNHPTKKDYYTTYSKNHNLPAPEFSEQTKSNGKLIDSSFLVQHLGYRFKFPL